MDKEWRPKAWDKIKHKICDCNFEPDCKNCTHYDTVEKIASAMLAACNSEWVTTIESSGLLHLYHSEVKEQWKNLKESKGIKD